MIGKKIILLLWSLGLSALISSFAIMGFHLTNGIEGSGFANRFFVLLGGNFTGGGYIQSLTYLAFFLSLFDIFQKKKILQKELKQFKRKLLPTNTKALIMAKDIKELQFKMIDLENAKKGGLLSDMIKKACTKFRSNNSIPEIMEVISAQTEINKEKSESAQSDIRYLTWVIPSIGFIGTVLGISQALMVANSGDMNIITSTLGVAFDTTLISLILSIIVMWFFHGLQEKTDNLHANIKEYVLENLVNRIEL